MRGFPVSVAIAALLILSDAAGSSEERLATGSDRAAPLGQAMLAVSAYVAPSYGREIQLVGLSGRRVRIHPHPPLPLDGAWSPDGRWIAFSGGDAEGYRGIYTSNSRGTNVRLVYSVDHPTGFSFVPSWSPDGKSIAFSDGAGLWIVGADGRGARRVADLGVEGWAAWSPDGRSLAFADPQGAVYTVRVNGTGLRRIARKRTPRQPWDEPASADVSWAPDGKRIAFTRYDLRPASEIDIVDADGRDERRIAWGDCPAWSPDGRRLAFVAQDRAGNILGISAVRPGTGRGSLITKRTGPWCPAWTADGRRVAFFASAGRAYVAAAYSGSVRAVPVAARAGLRLAPTGSQLWSADGKLLVSDGDFDANWYVVRVLTLRGAGATFRWSDDHAPAWSPDGQKLAFARTAKKTTQIFVVDADEHHARRLTAGTNPVWSPDGNWIAFERKKRVFIVPSAGGAARAVTIGGGPAWSPDSRWIAAGGPGLHVAPRDGGATRRFDQPRAECGGEAAIQPFQPGYVPPTARRAAKTSSPAWAHDGRTIAFGYWMQDCDEWNLAIVGSKGTSQVDVAHGEQPQWSPDDAHLVFIDTWSHLVYIGRNGADPLFLEEHASVESFSLTRDGELVAYAVQRPSGSEIWLVGTDGRDRRRLLHNGSDGEPAWQP